MLAVKGLHINLLLEDVFQKNNDIKHMAAEISGVAIHPMMILVMVLQLMLRPPLAMPIPIMAPITA